MKIALRRIPHERRELTGFSTTEWIMPEKRNDGSPDRDPASQLYSLIEERSGYQFGFSDEEAEFELSSEWKLDESILLFQLTSQRDEEVAAALKTGPELPQSPRIGRSAWNPPQRRRDRPGWGIKTLLVSIMLLPLAIVSLWFTLSAIGLIAAG